MRAGRATPRRLLYRVHSWVGLKLSIFMSLILITGTLAVISSELDWVTHASMRVDPRSDSERASWGALYQAARHRYPGWRIGLVTEPIDPWFAAQAYGYTPDGDTRLVDIDPYTAEVRGDRHWMSFHRFVRNSHRHLMLPVAWGVPLVSIMAILLMVSWISGIVIYKKFWRGFLKGPRRQGTRIFNGDLHRLLGVWNLWFIPVIALTGIFYLAESLGWRAPPFGEPVTAQGTTDLPTAAGVDAMAAHARQALPGFEIAVLLPPATPGDPLVFQGYTDGTWLVRPRASYVAFDAATGRILGQHRSRDATLHQRISEMADPLHFGYFAGLTSKLIWFVFGAGMSALSITGVVIYGSRVAKTLQRREATDAARVPA